MQAMSVINCKRVPQVTEQLEVLPKVRVMVNGLTALAWPATSELLYCCRYCCLYCQLLEALESAHPGMWSAFSAKMTETSGPREPGHPKRVRDAGKHG